MTINILNLLTEEPVSFDLHRNLRYAAGDDLPIARFIEDPDGLLDTLYFEDDRLRGQLRAFIPMAKQLTVGCILLTTR